MTGDDLRALPAGTVVDATGAEQEDAVVISRNHADALADFVDAVRRMRVDGCSCPTCGPLSGALAALDQEAPA